MVPSRPERLEGERGLDGQGPGEDQEERVGWKEGQDQQHLIRLNPRTHDRTQSIYVRQTPMLVSEADVMNKTTSSIPLNASNHLLSQAPPCLGFPARA